MLLLNDVVIEYNQSYSLIALAEYTGSHAVHVLAPRKRPIPVHPELLPGTLALGLQQPQPFAGDSSKATPFQGTVLGDGGWPPVGS